MVEGVRGDFFILVEVVVVKVVKMAVIVELVYAMMSMLIVLVMRLSISSVDSMLLCLVNDDEWVAIIDDDVPV